MRIALISDIHGNTIALDAVLADCSAHGIESYWFLGDYAAFGPEPAEVLERVTQLPEARFIRGNTDRYVVTAENLSPLIEAIRSKPERTEQWISIATSIAWTRGVVTATGWFDWLAALPLELRHTAPNGTRILAAHAAPGTDDGEGMHPGRSNAELADLLEGCDADVVFVAHTHEALVRRVGSRTVVNLGSLSNPRGADVRASYVLLEITEIDVNITPRRVAYDQARFADALQRVRYPAVEHILDFQRGDHPGRAPHADHVAVQAGETVRVGPPSA